MALSIEFCEAIECDQVRERLDDFAHCNLTGKIIYGGEFTDCPKVQQALSKARTEGRQQAAAELDRSAGQPPRTYIEKQSLVQLLTHIGCSYHAEEKSAIRTQDRLTMSKRAAQVGAINQLLKGIISGTPSLTEVEL